MSFKIFNKFYNYVQTPGVNISVISTDSNGQLIQKYIIDDSLPKASNILWTSEKIADGGAQLVVPSRVNDLAVIDVDGQYQDSGFIIDDSLPAASDVMWSSAKVGSCATKANLVVPLIANSLAKIDVTGQYQDSTLIVDDSVAPSTSVLYTSSKTDLLVANKADLSVPATAGNLAKIDALGQYQDSTLIVDDSVAPSTSVLYTSSKTDSLVANKADLSVPAVAGNVAGIDLIGQYQDSGFIINDSLPAAADVLWSSLKVGSCATKANLVVPLVAESLAKIDATGQYQDSTLIVDDSVAPSTSVLYTSSKTDSLVANKADLSVPATAGNLAKIDALGQYQDSTLIVDDSVAPSTSVLYTSSKTDSLVATKADLSVPATAGNLAKIDALGQYEDSTVAINDAVAPSTNILYTSSKTSSLLATKANLTVPATAGNLAGIDSLGQYEDSTIAINDAVAPSTSVLYTSNKTASLLATKANLTVPVIPGSLAGIDALGQYEDSTVLVDDTQPPSTSVLYTSLRLSQIRYYGYIQYQWAGSSTMTSSDTKYLFSPTYLPSMSKSSSFHIDSAPVYFTEFPANNIIKVSPFPDLSKHNFSKVTIVLRLTSNAATIDNNMRYLTFDLWRPDLTTLLERSTITKTLLESHYRSKSAIINTFISGIDDQFITNGLALSLRTSDPVTLTSFTLRFYFE